MWYLVPFLLKNALYLDDKKLGSFDQKENNFICTLKAYLLVECLKWEVVYMYKYKTIFSFSMRRQGNWRINDDDKLFAIGRYDRTKKLQAWSPCHKQI